MHVIQRGNNRAACFATRSDYLVYLLHLHELSTKFECSVHAYCLMPNHVHLLLTPASERACTGLMRELGQRYVQYFNRRQGRSGTLWEGRFRSSVTQSAHYVLACYRYVELNPVRAGLAERPEAYEWSSYKANSGQQGNRLVLAHPEFLALGTDGPSRHAAYRRLFEQALDACLLGEIRDATNAGYPLASASFKSGVVAPRGHKLEPGRPGRRPAAATTRREQSGSDPDFEFGL